MGCLLALACEAIKIAILILVKHLAIDKRVEGLNKRP
tara:strand:+ start:807 stop:917 length:111 start_codon:yes stop_codon:yes gene_type:complete